MAYTTSKTLLRQIQNGDNTAWSNFYIIYTPLIKSCGRKYNIEDSNLDDLVQIVMLKLFEKQAVSTYDPQKGKFRTYMGRIIFNTIMDIKRINIPVATSDIVDISAVNNDIQVMIENEWQEYAYKEAMLLLRQRVSEDVFQAFQMLTEHNMEPQSVADFLKLPLRHVYDAKARCKRMLTEILETLDA